MVEDPELGSPRWSRRRLLGAGVLAMASLVSSCRSDRDNLAPEMDGKERRGSGTRTEPGRLTARPRPSVSTAPVGAHPLALAPGRDGLVYAPARDRVGGPMPLVVMLHGAGGNARQGLDPLLGLADDAGLVLVSPESRGRTWDALLGGYGPDVAFMDRALAQVFDRYPVDPARVAVGGFSDGASYALSIGITNGDLFRHVLAFSPGFSAPASSHGSPRIFVSHGTHDEVLPIGSTSRRIVPRLRRAGHDVTYREFDGPHTVPPEIAREGLDWYLGRKA